MASHLANIFGTEQDRVNCSFYYKIGACRHGDRCSRKHIKPPFSQTLLLPNVYINPSRLPGLENQNMSSAELQLDFDTFYEDFFIELTKYGNVMEMHVCDNVGDHLMGNVYVRFEWEQEAKGAVDGLNERWYGGKPLYAELSPVTDFREACCRQNEMGECTRGGFCNFMHLSHPSRGLVKGLFHGQRLERRLKQSNPPNSTGTDDPSLGWVPPALSSANGNGAGDLGWVPPSAGGGNDDLGWTPGATGGDNNGDYAEGVMEGDSWRPSRR